MRGSPAIATRGCRRRCDVHGKHSEGTGEEQWTSFDLILFKFDDPKLKFSYKNLKFGQNKSCRGRKDLQLCFWAKIDSKPGLRTKTRSNAANSKVTLET